MANAVGKGEVSSVELQNKNGSNGAQMNLLHSTTSLVKHTSSIKNCSDIEHQSSDKSMLIKQPSEDVYSSVELAAVEFEEYIQLFDKEITYIEYVVSKYSRIRYLAYCCGLYAPSVSLSSPWYFYFFFIISWFVRVVYIFALVESIIIPLTIYSSSQEESISNYIYFTFNFIRFVALIPIMYMVCIRKRKYIILKHKETSGISIVQKLITESFYEVFYLLIFCIALCVNGSISWSTICSTRLDSDRNYYSYLTIQKNQISKANCNALTINFLVTPIGLLCLQSFLYFIFILDLKFVESYFDEMTEDVAADRLNSKKYLAIKCLIRHKQDNHIAPMGNYILVLVLGAVCLLLTIVDFQELEANHNIEIPLYFQISTFIASYFKDYFILTSIIWRVSKINMRSRDLTVKIAACPPRSDNIADKLYIFQQQVADPILFLVLGVVPVYRNDLILSIVTYVITITLTSLKETLPKSV